MSGLAGDSGNGYPVLTLAGESGLYSYTSPTQTTIALPLLDDGVTRAPYVALSGALGQVLINLGDANVDATKGAMGSTVGYLVFCAKGRSHLGIAKVSGNVTDLSVTGLAGEPRYLEALSFGSDAANSSSIDFGSTLEIPLPTTSTGELPRFVYVTGHGGVIVKPGLTGQTNHSPIEGIRIRTKTCFVLNVMGSTHMLATARAGTGLDISIVPLEI